MIVQQAAATLCTPTHSTASDLPRWQARPLALGMAERGIEGPQSSVSSYVLEGLAQALRAIPADLAAEVDFFSCRAEGPGAAPQLRVRLHYAPKRTFTAMHLNKVSRKLRRLEPRLLPTLLHVLEGAARDVLPCFGPDTALALHSASHTFYAESDEEFAAELRDIGYQGSELDASDAEVLQLARRDGLRTPSDAARQVPAYGGPYDRALLDRPWPPAVRDLCARLQALAAEAARLPPFSDGDSEASGEFLFPYYRESLLLDPFARGEPHLSFTREMHRELSVLDDDELPIRTFLLADGEDLDRLEQYLLAAPDMQAGVRGWLEALYAYGEARG